MRISLIKLQTMNLIDARQARGRLQTHLGQALAKFMDTPRIGLAQVLPNSAMRFFVHLDLIFPMTLNWKLVLNVNLAATLRRGPQIIPQEPLVMTSP
jgi:hypothetical protein